MAEQDDLLRRLVESLDEDPAYERHGAAQSTPWGSGQWVKFTDPDGRVSYLRIVVEPFQPTD